jgi:hypothetical protein
MAAEKEELQNPAYRSFRGGPPPIRDNYMSFPPPIGMQPPASFMPSSRHGDKKEDNPFAHFALKEPEEDADYPRDDFDMEDLDFIE